MNKFTCFLPNRDRKAAPFGIVCDYRYVNYQTSKDTYTTEQYAEFEKASGK